MELSEDGLQYVVPERLADRRSDMTPTATMFQEAFDRIEDQERSALTYAGHLDMLCELQDPPSGERLFFRHLDKIVDFIQSLLRSKVWRSVGGTLSVFEHTEAGPQKVLVYSSTEGGRRQGAGKRRSYSENPEPSVRKRVSDVGTVTAAMDLCSQLSKESAAANREATAANKEVVNTLKLHVEVEQSKQQVELVKAKVAASREQAAITSQELQMQWALDCLRRKTEALVRVLEDRETLKGDLLSKEEERELEERMEKRHVPPLARRYLDGGAHHTQADESSKGTSSSSSA
jgi:hypothetical protein